MTKEVNEAILFLKQHDAVIGKLIEEIGPCSLKPSDDYFRALVRSIVSQQLSNKAAASIYGKLLATLQNRLTTKSVLSVSESQFRAAGISRQKQRYLINLAREITGKKSPLTGINSLNNSEIIKLLVQNKGIGTWTAEMFMIFTLNRLDVLPLSDTGFRRALALRYHLKGRITDARIRRIARAWGHYQSVAVWYLWQSINK